MNDQSVQSVQIPQEIRTFLEGIIGEANMTSLDAAMHEEMLQQMFSRLDQHLTSVIMENLPQDKLDEFIKMNEEKKPQEEIQAYLQQQIPNVQDIMTNAFTEFRNVYLGSVDVSRNAPVDTNQSSS